MTDLPLYAPPNENRAQALARKRDALSRLALESGEDYRKAVDAIAVDVVHQTLRLTGVPVECDDVERHSTEVSDLVQGQFAALRLIMAEAEKKPDLTPELVSHVHRLSSPPSDGRYRTASGPRHFLQPPSPPELIGGRVENLCDWLAADSGREMHPTERAALAFARILEIAPFERGNFRTSHLLLSFFAVAGGYPPFYLRVEDAGAIRAEVDRAMVFDTASLVERFSVALGHSLERCRVGVGAHAPPAPP